VSRGLADTSVFIALESGRPLDVRSFPEQLSVSVITVAELRAGVLAATRVDVRDRRLTTLQHALALNPVPVDDAVGRTWALLRVALEGTGRRLKVNDSWIAATALTLDLPVVTQDIDYAGVPGLEVIAV